MTIKVPELLIQDPLHVRQLSQKLMRNMAEQINTSHNLFCIIKSFSVASMRLDPLLNPVNESGSEAIVKNRLTFAMRPQFRTAIVRGVRVETLL